MDRIFQTLYTKSQSPEYESTRRLHADNRSKIDSLNRTLTQLAALKDPAAAAAAGSTRRELAYFVSVLEKEYKIDEVL
jgi:hypothetical protein